MLSSLQATYYYQQASFLSMQANSTQQVIDKVILMYHQVPELKQRIAGKSIPVEKFAVAKSKKFLLHGIGNTLAGLVSGFIGKHTQRGKHFWTRKS